MGAPIVFRPQYGPWDQLLPQMFMMKMKHNYDVKERELAIQQKDAALKEQRGYTEDRDKSKRQGQLAEKGFTPTAKGSEGSVDMPVAGGSYIPPSTNIYTDKNFPGMVFKKDAKGSITMHNLPSESEKSRTEEQLVRTTLSGTPEEKTLAKKELKILQDRKITIAQQGRMPLGSMATSTPGIIYDRLNKKFVKRDDKGKLNELSSKEVLDEALKYQQDRPTNDIKVMQQSVPSVLHLTAQIRKNIDAVKVGPLAGRWKGLSVDKIGLNDPAWRKLRSSLDLATTRLMKMHVGAQGSEFIMKHFDNLFQKGKTSPENLTAVIDTIEDYANSILSHKLGATPNLPTGEKNNTTKQRTISETRVSPDGRKIHKYSDGTIGYE